MEAIEKKLLAAIRSRIDEISEEECKKAYERIKARIATDCLGLAPLIIKNMSFDGVGTVKLVFEPK